MNGNFYPTTRGTTKLQAYICCFHGFGKFPRHLLTGTHLMVDNHRAAVILQNQEDGFNEFNH